MTNDLEIYKMSDDYYWIVVVSAVMIIDNTEIRFIGEYQKWNPHPRNQN